MTMASVPELVKRKPTYLCLMFSCRRLWQRYPFGSQWFVHRCVRCGDTAGSHEAKFVEPEKVA